MALSPSIEVLQSAITPANVTITDNSGGSDVAITQRRVFVSDSEGNYLTGDGTVNYTEWALADVSITLSILTQDIGANVKTQWLDVGNEVLYEYDNTYPLAKFNKNFFVYLVQLQGLAPSIYQDTNYSSNIAVFWTNIKGGVNAVEEGNNIAAAQNCFDRATYMRLHQSDFF